MVYVNGVCISCGGRVKDEEHHQGKNSGEWAITSSQSHLRSYGEHCSVKIRQISIKNFRGVKELDWALPASNIFCLIGKGDSSKSTVLEATFPPNLFADFYEA